MSTRTLNEARFAKVCALHNGTTSPGERAAAANKMAALAQAAGMTVEQAIDTANGRADPWAAFVAKHERELAAKAADVRTRYGSDQNLFTDTPVEAVLRAASVQLPADGQQWLAALDGFGSTTTMPDCIRVAIDRASRLPRSVAIAWAEYATVDRLSRDRGTVDLFHEQLPLACARQALVEQLLNTLPARSLNDVRARLDWLDHWVGTEYAQEPADHRAVLSTLRADIERMATRIPRGPAA